jgi:uncharacterized protein (TIGR03382 family)
VRFVLVVSALALLSSTAVAEARPFRVGDIPNGSKNTCLNCHGDTKGSVRTDFGSDAQNFLEPGTVQLAHVNWAPLCPLDSDGDGWTNGKELGDPNCTWKAGDPNPNAYVWNPGDPASHPLPVCGNGKLDADEPCEGSMLSETDCAIEDAGEGTLGCTAECKLDYSGCSSPPGETASSGGLDESPSEEGGCNSTGGRAPMGGAAAIAAALGLAWTVRRRRRAA